ncbi:MAG: serine hydroxymethyltransferase [Candidatus Aminicenantaceae bacterium]
MSSFYERIHSLSQKIIKNNTWRQKESFNLIPSETTPSILVKMCEISDPSGRYAEHRTMKGEEIYFYQGTDFIRDVELEVQRELGHFFGCSEVELRPISGQMANEVVFKGIVRFLNRNRTDGQPFRRITCVMNNELTKGGHLSSQPMGALFNYVQESPETGKDNVINFPVQKENPYKPDLDLLAENIQHYKPELIIFGKSMFIYQEPIKFISDVVKEMEPRPIIMYDMAHVLGLYGAFQVPLEEGADVITGSTHKTFFGPQRGMIAGNFPKGTALRPLWLDIKSRAFPGSTSNHHLGTLLALLMAAYEMNEFKESYQRQVQSNAKAFARYLKDKGITVEGDESDSFTESHQVLIRVRDYGLGQEIARRLEENNIVTNYQALPDDETFLESSGIRMGVQEMTRFGMKESDFDMLSGLIADIIIRNKNVREEVKEFRQKFLQMKFCLSPQEALPIVSKVIKSIFPYPDFADLFIENFQKNV